MQRISLLLFAVMFVFASCSSDKAVDSSDNSDGTQLSFYLRYLESESKVKAIAECRVMNEDSIMVADSFVYNIWVQGRPLETLPEISKPGYYSLDLDHAQPGKFEFVFEDKNGKPETYTFNLLPKDSISVLSFRDTQGLELQFSNQGLEDEESLIIVVTDVDNASASTTINGSQKGTVTVPYEVFSALKPGTLTLYLVRKTRIIAQHETGRKYVAELEYYYNDIKYELEKAL